MMVNPLMFESIVAKDSYHKQLRVLPDPVPPALKVDVDKARAYFGLPEDAVLLGAVGMMDSRKAIPEVLDAFSSIRARIKGVKLVLLGQLEQAYEALINSQYAQLVADGDLIVVNRYLSQYEVQLAYAAIDVLLVMQYRRANLSANFLKAMMYDKPIIADDFGYTGMMLSRFKLGYACTVADSQSIQTAMLSAVDAKDSYVPTVQTARLKAFHSPENFTNTLLNDVFDDDAKFPVKTWEWVCGDVR